MSDHVLRDPAESALNDVARRCVEASGLYADAAGRTGDASVAGLFRELADERRAMADDLHGVVRQMGELPEATDPDADALHRLLNAARSVLSSEPERELLRDREKAEADLARAMQAALDEDLPERARERVARFLARVESVRAQLAAAADHRES